MSIGTMPIPNMNTMLMPNLKNMHTSAPNNIATTESAKIECGTSTMTKTR
jgi:hypothetical protein